MIRPHRQRNGLLDRMITDAMQRAVRMLAADERIYAIGDIHGMSDCLLAVFARIAADRGMRPVARATEIYLGDFIDKGPDSAGVLEQLAYRENAILICGNHERAMLRALITDDGSEAWMRIGARETLMSYGVAPPPSQPLADALAALRKRLPAGHSALLKRLQSFHRVGDFLFVHAGIRPGRPIEQQSLRDLTTIRSPFLESDGDHAAIVIHGHTPCERPEIRHNRINLDTGAYLSGKLSCLAIDRDGLRLI